MQSKIPCCVCFVSSVAYHTMHKAQGTFPLNTKMSTCFAESCDVSEWHTEIMITILSASNTFDTFRRSHLPKFTTFPHQSDFGVHFYVHHDVTPISIRDCILITCIRAWEWNAYLCKYFFFVYYFTIIERPFFR